MNACFGALHIAVRESVPEAGLSPGKDPVSEQVTSAPRQVICRAKLATNQLTPTGAMQVAVRVNVPAAGISLAEDVYGPFSGQVTSAVRQAMRRAVLEAHVRLVEAMFLCEVSSTAEVLSGMAPNTTSILKEPLACALVTPKIRPSFGVKRIAVHHPNGTSSQIRF